MNDIKSLFYLRIKILKNKVFSIDRESNLKVSIIILFVFAYAGGSFWALCEGFDYISNKMGLGYFIIDRMFYMFFFVLFAMLTISQLIITYSNFYRNRETAYLFSLPVSQPAVFMVKFLESTFLSSWAFVFLVVPVFLAYGVSRSLGIGFYFVSMSLAIPFIFIAASLGTIMGMLLVKLFNMRFLRIFVTTAIVAAISAYLYYRWLRGRVTWDTGDMAMFVDQIFRQTQISMSVFLPSYWLTKGIFSFLQSQFTAVIFYYLLLLSTALFFVWLSYQLGKRIYLSSWQSLSNCFKTKYYHSRLLAGFCQKNWWAALAVKDLKLFVRDPVQWSQFAVFFGIIGVYILNIRQMNYNIESLFWKNLISYLNLGTIALTLGVLSTRFIYPQWSLENKKRWIVGLSPVGPGKVLLVKYLVSTIFCTILTLLLMIVSNIMVEVPGYIFWLSIFTMLLMGLTLPALALGFGVIFPNFKEDDMAKIVSGFGGTLTLVVSLLYILFVLVMEIIPLHLYYTKQLISQLLFIKWMVGAGVAIFLVSLLAGYLPMYLGCRHLHYDNI